jgi:putative ABC transport system substrate-binding protein
MRRREFITLLGGATAWPLAAGARQANQLRRIGVLTSLAADDPEAQLRITAFAQALQELGWTIRHNIRIDTRWGAVDAGQIRKSAMELVALAPDVILASGSTNVRESQQATQTVPIVFVTVTDPVGGGLVRSLARPGGNTTGFTSFEYGISAKWLELLKQVAPLLSRVAVIRDSADPSSIGLLAGIQPIASSLGIELTPIGLGKSSEIEDELVEFAHAPNGAVIVTASRLAGSHRALIIRLAEQYRLPAVYPYRYYAADGGLLSYGPDIVDQWRRAAGYIDRILKGDKPADLPVQASTKYELVINLNTAKGLGLRIPDKLLALADEVIE